MNRRTNSSRPERPILIIEHDAALLDSLVDLLEFDGYAVECAYDGQEALERLDQTPVPCLIILDWLMPGLEAQEFLDRRRSDPALAAVPVLVTGSTWEIRPGGEIPEADDYLVKPFSTEALLVMVERLCGEADGRANAGQEDRAGA